MPYLLDPMSLLWGLFLICMGSLFRSFLQGVPGRQRILGMECQKTALFALTLAAGSAEYRMLGWTSLFVSNLEALLSCLLASSIVVENSDVILALGPLHLALEPFRSSLYPRVLQFHKAAPWGVGVSPLLALETEGHFQHTGVRPSTLQCSYCFEGSLPSALPAASLWTSCQSHLGTPESGLSLSYPHLFVSLSGSIFWKAHSTLSSGVSNSPVKLLISVIILLISNSSFFFSKYLFLNQILILVLI